MISSHKGTKPQSGPAAPQALFIPASAALHQPPIGRGAPPKAQPLRAFVPSCETVMDDTQLEKLLAAADAQRANPGNLSLIHI